MKKKVAGENPSLFRQIAPRELRKGDLRKLQIVQATVECLAKRGWSGTNYETVGQLCSMKRPHVAYHYPDWNTLIESALKFVYATGSSIVADGLREAKTPKERLKAYIEGTFHWLASRPEQAAAITLNWHLATFDKRFCALSTEFKRLGTTRVYAILTDTEGPAPKPSDPRWLCAVAIHALIVGRCVEFFSTDFGGGWADTAKETFDKALLMWPRSQKR